LSEEKVDGVISWLSSTVGLNGRDIITVIHRFPNLLSYSISDNLQRSLNYLKEEMKLDTRSIQNSILYAPDLLARRLELLAVHAASAREAGISSSDFASIVRAYPGILRLNLMSNLHRAKLRFLEEELGRDVSPALATNPMYVTYSLPRIVTRAAFLKVSADVNS
jgi:hypothetical protein